MSDCSKKMIRCSERMKWVVFIEMSQHERIATDRRSSSWEENKGAFVVTHQTVPPNKLYFFPPSSRHICHPVTRLLRHKSTHTHTRNSKRACCSTRCSVCWPPPLKRATVSLANPPYPAALWLTRSTKHWGTPDGTSRSEQAGCEVPRATLQTDTRLGADNLKKRKKKASQKCCRMDTRASFPAALVRAAQPPSVFSPLFTPSLSFLCVKKRA